MSNRNAFLLNLGASQNMPEYIVVWFYHARVSLLLLVRFTDNGV